MRDGRSRRKVDHGVESHEMNGLEQPVAGAGTDVRAATWGVHGDQDLLVEAARILRYGLESGVIRSHLSGEYAIFGLARLLDALAFSLHRGNEVHHTVVSGAMEIAHHVKTYLLPSVRAHARGQDQQPDPAT
jgi:hypothetical protein